MQEFKISRKGNVGVLHFTLKGYLGERADFGAPMLENVEDLHIDFDGVNFINSVGINTWLKWITTLKSNQPSIVVHFHKCPKAIVDQVNSIKGFLPGGGLVESFYMPFYDEENDKVHNVLLVRGTDYQEKAGGQEGWVKIPKVNTPGANTEMQPDVVTERYLKFIK